MRTIKNGLMILYMKKAMLITVGLLCLISHVNAQSGNWINVNDTNSGLNNNIISCIAQDSEKNLWIGMTNGSAFQYGLDKFDGINWTHFDMSNSGLPSDAVTDIVIDASDNIWISFNEKVGLCKYDGTTWTVFDTTNSNIPSNQIWGLTLSDNNELWLACEGVTKYTPDSFINYHSDPYIFDFQIENDYCYALTRSANGFKIINLATNSYQVYKGSNSNIPSDYPSSVSFDNNGILWIGFSYAFDGGLGMGGSNGGLATFDGTDFTTINPFGSSSTWVYYDGSIVVDSSNHVWVSSRCEGLYKYDNSSWSQISDIPNNGCAGFVFIDNDNYIWYGDVYSGLWTNKPSLINILDRNHALGNIMIYPNPTTGLITVTGLPAEPARITVYNILGELVHGQELNASGETVIDLSALADGLYLIQFQYRQMTLKEKVIKQSSQ